MDHGTSISYAFCYARSICDGHQWWGMPITFKNKPLLNPLPHDIMTFHLVGLDVFIGGNFKKDENIFNQNKRVYSYN
jgi:hypothetical protein